MSTLADIEAAVESLPSFEQQQLLAFLAARFARRGVGISPALATTSPPLTHSVLDIPVAHVGRVLHPPSADDDLLGEMLEGRA